jgi:hypothetical protein
MYEYVNLKELEQLILAKLGLHRINPADCQIISILIQKKLKKNISETTLKRFFGFAEAKHDFSQFTINTLKEFVGLLD